MQSFASLSCKLLAVSIIACSSTLLSAGEFPKIVNTQPDGQHPPTAAEAAERMTVPEGFQVTLFAGEPHIAQPVSFTIDHRGRLWVAESYTYEGGSYSPTHQDRLVILEDVDGDGRFDERKVFWDRGVAMTSVLPGFGGVYVLSGFKLMHIPDRNGDDVPDGEPTVLLDGFTDRAGHNFVNGLMWGPDGWIYGRHGITDTSYVGKPGTPPDQRIALNCSIWRYHPTRHVVEVVTHGTTNPWGLDYDDHGQMFFTNNVIGHLWHVVPGAHYERMFGQHFNPHLYQLIDQTADHYHWDTGKNWTDSREAAAGSDELGGGHSHCGGMIYLGDNWPSRYRGAMFMCNTHGRRVNMDRFETRNGLYVATHGPDFLHANNPWFRGTELRYGPDGGVYLSDWTDLGECHDHDGVHRTSGRIYKVVYGKPTHPGKLNLAELSNSQLVQLQLHRNDWYVRHARRLLQERAAAGQDLARAHEALHRIFQQNPDVTRKLRAMWALYVTGGADRDWLLGQLDHPERHVRLWAVKLLVDQRDRIPSDLPQRLARMASSESSVLVRLFIASAMQRLPLTERFAIAAALMKHVASPDQPLLPLMVWYALEPAVVAAPDAAVALIAGNSWPLIRENVARRLTFEIKNTPEPVAALVQLGAEHSAEYQRQILEGMALALRGWQKAPQPANWQTLAERASSGDDRVRELSQELSLVFGDGRALTELRKVAGSDERPLDERQRALAVLIENPTADLLPLLHQLAKHRDLVELAARGLAEFDHPRTPQILLNRYRWTSDAARSQIVATLTSRPAYALALLDAVAKGRVAREDVTPYHARQMLALGDENVAAKLREVWGEVRQSGADKQRLIEQYTQLLTPDRLDAADASQGRVVFTQLCAACHKLYGEGNTIGPDLTGSNRDSLVYLLQNIIDPSAIVPADARLTMVHLTDGRILTGAIIAQNDQTLTLRTLTEEQTIARDQVVRIVASPVSLMPEGLLGTMTEPQVANLVKYLMSRSQVPLPTSK